MKAKTREDDALDVGKIAEQLNEYQKSSARGGLKINMPLKDALRAIARVKPERRKPKKSALSWPVVLRRIAKVGPEPKVKKRETNSYTGLFRFPFLRLILNPNLSG
jgi:hypothetical protein